MAEKSSVTVCKILQNVFTWYKWIAQIKCDKIYIVKQVNLSIYLSFSMLYCTPPIMKCAKACLEVAEAWKCTLEDIQLCRQNPTEISTTLHYTKQRIKSSPLHMFTKKVPMHQCPQLIKMKCSVLQTNAHHFIYWHHCPPQSVLQMAGYSQHQMCGPGNPQTGTLVPEVQQELHLSILGFFKHLHTPEGTAICTHIHGSCMYAHGSLKPQERRWNLNKWIIYKQCASYNKWCLVFWKAASHLLVVQQHVAF